MFLGGEKGLCYTRLNPDTLPPEGEFMSDTHRSSELMARASQFLAGGTMHHTTHGSLPQELQPIVARGEGSRFWDVDGKEYIDYVMGSGPLILGHAHPEVVEAAEKQAAAGSQYYNLSESMIDLAETIVSAVPCGQRIKFAGSGNEATMMALRLARAVTGKPKIMKMEGGYHGTHDYTAWAGTHKEPFEYPLPAPRLSRHPRRRRRSRTGGPLQRYRDHLPPYRAQQE